MRLVLLLVFIFHAATAGAQSDDQPFDARGLTFGEKRFLQAALAWDGPYNGLLDGKWGKISQSALETSLTRAQPRFRDLRPLIEAFARETVARGWRVIHFEEEDFSLLLPLSLLDIDEAADHFTVRSADNSLLVRILFERNGKTGDMHRWLVDNHVGPEPAYRSWNTARLITAAKLPGGKSAYLRSFPKAGYFVSTLVQFDPSQKGRGQLIIASLGRGNQAKLTLPTHGRLVRLFDAPDAPSPPPDLADLAAPRAAQGRAEGGGVSKPLTGTRGRPEPKGTGTGFFVNTTDVVTAAHVVTGCTSLTLEDGTPLAPISVDPGLDLAVLGAATRWPSHLPLSAARDARLGEDVFALGFPYRGLFDQGLTVTGGNVSALPALDDPAKRLMITAPIQPGNSGGPILNRSGEVIAVVVSRADDLAVLHDTGTLPQNINFGVSVSPLMGFLKAANILYPQGGQGAFAIGNGIPEDIQRSVVPILCY